MKILLIYSYNKGFLSSFFTELSQKLSDEGHEVMVFSLKAKEESFFHGKIKIIIKRRGGYFNNYFQIFKIIKILKPEVILSNFSYVNPSVLFGNLLSVKNNIVWFHTVYGHAEPGKFKVFIKKLFLRLADKVITNSNDLLEEMISIYGVSRNKLVAIPFWTNIINFKEDNLVSSFHREEGYFYIGCPGRLVADKNHMILLKFLNGLNSWTKRKTCVVIAGDGPFLDTLETFTKENNLTNNVLFLGTLSSSQMVDYYHNIDLVVLPSFHEAFGLVFIEAISLGVPVLVSSRFGALNFLNLKKYDFDSFVFNPESIDDLNKKIMPYLENNGLDGSFFRDMYLDTFDKEKIYETIKETFFDFD